MNNAVEYHVVELYISQLKNTDNRTTFRPTFLLRCIKAVNFHLVVESFIFLFLMFFSYFAYYPAHLPDTSNTI